MKKASYLVALVCIVLISSCGNKVSSPILGKWKLVKMELPKIDIAGQINAATDSLGKDSLGMTSAMDTMAKGLETMTNAMTDMGEALANSFLKGSVYNFKDDGTLSVSILFGSQEGTYTLSPDNKTLKTKLDGKEEEYTVTSVNEKELLLTAKSAEVWQFERKD
jgi:hypothetical protein